MASDTLINTDIYCSLSMSKQENNNMDDSYETSSYCMLLKVKKTIVYALTMFC